MIRAADVVGVRSGSARPGCINDTAVRTPSRGSIHRSPIDGVAALGVP
jgi:hypothetical protein